MWLVGVGCVRGVGCGVVAATIAYLGRRLGLVCWLVGLVWCVGVWCGVGGVVGVGVVVVVVGCATGRVGVGVSSVVVVVVCVRSYDRVIWAALVRV